MRSIALLISCAAAAAVLAANTPAAAQGGPTYARDQRVHHPRHVRTARPQGDIACGKYGCHPIPPGCHPEPGFDWWGNPTGYDVTICR